PPRTGGRQVGEGQPHAGLQAGDVVTLQFLIGQIGQKLAQEQKRQQEGEVGQTAGEEGRHNSVDEAAQEAEQAKQVGLGLPAEVADARKERRKKGDLRPPWKTKHLLFHQTQEDNENQLRARAQGVDVNEPCAGRQGLEGDQLPRQAFAQAGKESILG